MINSQPKSSPNYIKEKYDNGKITDYRDTKAPVNDVLIASVHASNDLPEGYSWSEHDTKYFKNEHWGYDPGSLNMAIHTAKELKLMLVQTLYSRLLVDANRDAASEGLFRKSGDGRDIDLNKSLNPKEEQLRMEKYYFGFHSALKDAADTINPKVLIHMHSYTPLYEGKKRELEMGILAPNSDLDLAEKLLSRFQKKGYFVRINEPYSSNTIITTDEIFARNEIPVKRKGITMEVRNDILTDPESFKRVSKDMVEVLKDVLEL